MLALLVYVAATPVPNMLLEQVGRVHASLEAASFKANSRLSGVGPTSYTSYEIGYRWPTNFRLRTLSPSTGQLLRDWSIEPGRIVNYDPFLEQYTAQARKDDVKLGKCLAQLSQNLDDVILAFADPVGMGVWLEPMVALAPWTMKLGASSRTLTFTKQNRKIALVIDSATSRLKRADITTGVQKLEWDFEYRPRVEGLAFVAPHGSYEVPVFDREMKPPKYADKDAQRAAVKMFDAYADLSSIGYRVTRETGTTTIYLRGQFARQEDDIAVWTYDGKALVLFNKKTHKWYAGQLSFRDVIDAVGSLGTRVDPTLRLLMTGFNPYRKRLGDGATVKKLGTLTVNNEPTTILQSVSDNAQITLIVRDSDGRVINSSTRARRQEPGEEGSVDLKFEYLSVPSDVETRYRVAVPRGETTTKLTPRPAT